MYVLTFLIGTMDKYVGIFIANLNRISLTRNLIVDILCNNYYNREIYLYDQNSNEDGTNEFLKAASNIGIHVIRNNSNVPLNHLWSEFKYKCNCHYLCFLNNDIRITKNFIKDDVEVLNNNPNIGITIHQTNHPDHLKATLDSTIYDEINSHYQGWAFTIRRELMPDIPKELELFYGDDYIFSKVVKDGKNIAFVKSSPMIHLCSQTHAELGDINEIMIKDSMAFYDIMEKEGLTKLKQMVITGKSMLYPQTKWELK